MACAPSRASRRSGRASRRMDRPRDRRASDPRLDHRRGDRERRQKATTRAGGSSRLCCASRPRCAKARARRQLTRRSGCADVRRVRRARRVREGAASVRRRVGHATAAQAAAAIVRDADPPRGSADRLRGHPDRSSASLGRGCGGLSIDLVRRTQLPSRPGRGAIDRLVGVEPPRAHRGAGVRTICAARRASAVSRPRRTR